MKEEVNRTIIRLQNFKSEKFSTPKINNQIDLLIGSLTDLLQ